MRAIAQDGYGGADVLELRELDRPVIGESQVLVRVAAAGVDPGVWHLMTGRPYLIRVMGFGLRRPKAVVRGRDLAGVVEAVGELVTRFRPGDEVFGTTEAGSFAEFAVAAQDRLALKPDGVPFEQAAVVPVSGITALQAVRDAGRVGDGSRVMVIGAGGGVGGFATQIARAYGGIVTAVCGPGKAELVRSLGASEVIDYTCEPIDRDGAGYDVIIDTAGNRRLSALRRALAPGGTLVIVGGEHGKGWLLGGFGRQLAAPVASAFAGRRYRPLMARENAADLDRLGELIVAGQVRPVIDREYPLERAADAIRYLDAGHAAGKVVLTI